MSDWNGFRSSRCEKPSENPGLWQAERKGGCLRQWIYLGKFMHHGFLLFTRIRTHRTHTDTNTKRMSIVQRVLFNNAQGRDEGCHFEKTGSLVTEQTTGYDWLITSQADVMCQV